ncbi:xanthine dehydrogenase family protein molybdopterin-binding subunit [Thermomicrobium sp. 4228-Ro]|uniref:xanthine dehydrogenase family protein molybdopterin-binding subunit n=1 Tax=Thermomicrobium sp. 4228-Ro TaxID=2993937 RepID=UPI00224891D4|nr:xanthine dehydrogenase family protein molybdopterin-binding subunit [Thermomicrobium sp. 4228-Ro]MCX2727515.1 xanthine dehydrogenase family protein molybdopterin-binding subunit [Thermomicrobium sp. 4228-Ro]
MTEGRYLGRSIRRLEDERFLRGLSNFTDDIRLERALSLVIVRSPYPHATIARIDWSGAARVRGFVAAFRGTDLASWIAPFPTPPQSAAARPQQRYPLAIDRVRYVGEGVVAVLAETRAAAIDAAAEIMVEYDELPAVVDPETALLSEAPRVHPEWPDNIAFAWDHQHGDIEAVFRDADVVVELELVNQRVHAAFMEPRAAAATYDAQSRQLTVWASTQTPHTLRAGIATVLGLPEHQIRVIAPDVGGAFGAKGGLYPEYVLVAALAWKLQQPIKWVETRSESFVATNHGRDQRQRVRAAFRRDGTLLGLDADIVSNLGAWNASPTRPTAVLTGFALAGPYRVPTIRLRIRCVVTNTTPQSAYRGAGRPEASYLLERLMDAAASRLGLDPVTIRQKNLLRPEDFPYTSPTGVPYDSGNYPAVLAEALRCFDYAAARRQQATLRAQGRLVGIGIASFCELSGPGWESATVRAHPDGSVTVLCGIAPSGQGHATMLAQVVGEILELPLERIRAVTGDTAAIQQGIGTFGSRSTALGGSAAYLAAQEVLEKARFIAAHALEVDPADLDYRDGVFTVRGVPDRSIAWDRVTRLAYVMEGPPGGVEPGLEATRFFNPGRRNIPFGVHIAMVEIDPETGEVRVLRYLAVDDSGRIVNPLLAEGQIHGSVAQGLGQALFEAILYSESGQPLTQSFLDYVVPRATQVPSIETAHCETPSPINPLGAKGIGEAGTTAAPPALVNAVLDALRPLGIEHLDMPLTPERIWQAIRSARNS